MRSTSEQTITAQRKKEEEKQCSLGHVNPAVVVKYLRGMHYPASKKNMMDSAQSKNAPNNVMDLIGLLPDKTYISPIDVTKEMGKIK